MKSSVLMRSSIGKTGSHIVQRLLAIKTLGGRAALEPQMLHGLAVAALKLITELDAAAATEEARP